MATLTLCRNIYWDGDTYCCEVHGERSIVEKTTPPDECKYEEGFDSDSGDTVVYCRHCGRSR